MRKRVRTLLRVSSRQQLHDNDIPIQRAETARFIAAHPDWVFDREYMEKAVSAYKNGAQDREVLQQILADAKEKQFDILLTYMSDRIGRQEEYSFYVVTLNQLGIEVWTIKDGQLKTEEHVDKLLNYIRFWQNEGESKKTSMRVKDTQRELVKAGKFVGGRAPFGYRLVPSGLISNHGRLLKKLEIVEEQAKVVRKIYSLAIHQGMGYEKIAGRLNEERIPAISADLWRAGTIRSILTNPVYKGYLAINRRENQGRLTRLDRKEWTYSDAQIPELVIVSEETWERAQRIREARKRRINAAKEKTSGQYEAQYHVPFSTKGKLALVGLVYCGYCGKRLKNGSYCNHWTVKATGEERTSFAGRYLCPQKCEQRSCYAQSYLEGIVFEVLEGYLEGIEEVDIAGELRKLQEQHRERGFKELRAIRKEQGILRLDMETLEEKIPEAIRGEYYFDAKKLAEMIEEKEQALKKLESEAEILQSRLGQLPARDADTEDISVLAPDWKKEFHHADTETKRMLTAAMVERIEVKDMAVKIRFRFR